MKTYSTDGLGRLVSSTSASGRAVTFDSSGDALSSVTVIKSTGDGVVSSVAMSTTTADGTIATATLPNGTVTSTQVDATGARIERAPDGTVTTTTYSPDPRFGMQVPIASTTVTTPSGLSLVTTKSRTVTPTDFTDPLSITTLTDATTVNGATWTTVYSAASGNQPATVTNTSPMSRVTSTTANAQGDVVSSSVSDIAPTTVGYDTHGRLASTTQGTFVQAGATLSRTYSYGYDANSYVNTTTDPLSNVVSFTNTLAGHPTDTFTPDGYDGIRDLKATYDGDGNLRSLTLPKGEEHDMTYTPADALASYEPPTLPGGTDWTTTYDYTTDGRPSHEYRPDGTTITYGYDTAGRLASTTAPVGAINRTYDPTTGQLATLSTSWLDHVNEALSFGYDGFLQTQTAWTGTVVGTVSFGYDNNFRMTSRTVNGASVSFGYGDLDGLLTGAGGMTITRDPDNGRVTGTTLGGVTDTYQYDANGLLSSYEADFDGALLYSETITSRDGLGRITAKTDAYSGGESHAWTYGYDAAGRLRDVTEDGQATGHYDYDTDDNRTSATTLAGGTVTATYDAQDRLLSYGSTTYTYGANGELQTKTDATGTTEYTYDSFGNLRNVTPPTGSAIDYVIDGLNRRVGRKVGGSLVQALLYQGQLNVAAELDGTGELVAQYAYGTKANVPEVKTDGSGTYRIINDHLGSPRLLVNSADGRVLERTDFSDFGSITFDSLTSRAIPFGFAGGLYDPTSGLTRFGARDYDSTTGRWESKDPIRFEGAQLNLYVYASDEPVSAIDPNGEMSCLPDSICKDKASPAPTQQPGQTKKDCIAACQSYATQENAKCNSCASGGQDYKKFSSCNSYVTDQSIQCIRACK